MSDDFGDHFSGHAALYAQSRPTYPEALYTWLAEIAPRTGTCWDAGAGNGQAAVALAAHFDQVIASDASPEQIAQAIPAPRVSYRVARAESSGLDDSSVDLVTVATAAHWFDHEAFYAEVRRVCRPDAVIAVWAYTARVRVTPAIDAEILRFADEILGPYWPPGMEHNRARYATLPFPFEPIEFPEFTAEVRWDLDGFINKLRSWSAIPRYRAACADDPIEAVRARLAPLWGEAGTRTVGWPLHGCVGRVGPCASGDHRSG